MITQIQHESRFLNIIMNCILHFVYGILIIKYTSIFSLETNVTNSFDKKDKRKPFEIIELVPVDCSNINFERFLWAEAVKYYVSKINEKCDVFSLRSYNIPMTNQSAELTNMALDIILDIDHYNSTSDCSNIKHLSKVVGVLGPLNKKQTGYISNFFNQGEVPIMTFSGVCDSLCDVHPSVIRTIPTDRSQVAVIESLLKLFRWTYVSVLYENIADWKSGYEKLRALSTVCLSKEISIHVNLSNVNDSVESLNNDKKSNVYIVFGSDSMKQAVFQEASRKGIVNKTWIFAHTSDRNPLSSKSKKEFRKKISQMGGHFLFVFPNAGRDVKFEKHFMSLGYSINKLSCSKRNFRERKDNKNRKNTTSKKRRKKLPFDSVGFVRNAIMVFTSFWLNQLQAYKERYKEDLCVKPRTIDDKLRTFNYVPSLRNVSFIGLNDELIEFDKNGNIKNYFYNVYTIQAKRSIKKLENETNKVDEISSYKSKKTRKFDVVLFANWSSTSRSFDYIDSQVLSTLKDVHSVCSSECPPGYTNKTFNSQKPCCWDCVPCPKDHVKYLKGNVKCQKCPTDTISNQFQTKCISRMIIDIQDNEYAGIIILSTSSFCMIANIFILVIFILKRHTPVVRSSSFISSLCQLLCHLLLFASSCLVVVRIPSVQCQIIPTIFLLITIIIAITITKVSRIVFIFRCRRKIKKEQIRKLKKEEFAFVISCATFNILMSILLHVFLKTGIVAVTEMAEDSYVAYHECHSSSVFFIANTLYILVLEIACGIQCFRGRNTPDQYNEAKYISYATYLSTVAICMSIILRHGITSSKNSKLLQILLLIVVNLSVLMSLYGYKVIIIIFRPASNTKKVFKTALWEDNKPLKKSKRKTKLVRCIIAAVNPAYEHAEVI